MTKKEIETVHMAYDYVLNILEGCFADEESQQSKDLQFTLSGLWSIMEKEKNRKPKVNMKAVLKRANEIIKNNSTNEQ